ncbi:hypothetical protein UFOVP19_9 [uncultured Caudovirales phage]|uniref:Uncharacterized protein n=1 Tax=uncultured Caudovirales phage TaxID=2100421 RepID=A0A6J5KL27_9CAUD|nr:hypothetical protein UFOVP19_9 [uncultured Caudovirales phage]
MGLKITTEIGTDKGITSEAYVRIGDYRVSKYNIAVFMIETYLNQTIAETITNPNEANDNGCKNAEIGQTIHLGVNYADFETTTIFAFGYAKLKERLVAAFGVDNVVDC